MTWTLALEVESFLHAFMLFFGTDVRMSGGSTVLDEEESFKKYPKKLFDSSVGALSVDRGLELLEVQAVQQYSSAAAAADR